MSISTHVLKNMQTHEFLISSNLTHLNAEPRNTTAPEIVTMTRLYYFFFKDQQLVTGRVQ